MSSVGDVEAGGVTDAREDLPEARRLPLDPGAAAQGTLTGKSATTSSRKAERGWIRHVLTVTVQLRRGGESSSGLIRR